MRQNLRRIRFAENMQMMPLNYCGRRDNAVFGTHRSKRRFRANNGPKIGGTTGMYVVHSDGNTMCVIVLGVYTRRVVKCMLCIIASQ